MRLLRDQIGRPAREFAKECGERATASATTRDGVLVVSTDHALYLGELRYPWDRVAKASWDSDESTLTVVGSPDVDEPVVTTVVGLDDATRLLDQVRVAVTSNIVVSQRIESSTFGGAWVTARRVPGTDELRWAVLFDPGRDPRDPILRAWADENVSVIRASTGV